MARNWLTIAKVEFKILTVSLRPHQKLYTGILYALGIIWAASLAPLLINGFITALIPLSDIRYMLMGMFPGLMRSVMMFLWIMLLMFPMSRALEEVKIGHWEIFLSNNVKTRDIMTGSFLGMSPLYGFVTLVLAPILMSPFILAFEVSLLGIALIYSVIVLNIISVLWISNFLIGAIQSKLGSSSRGKDLARGMSMLIALAGILPMYGLLYAAPLMSDVLGMNAFLLFPFTWSADVVSWIAITFNGIGLTSSQIIGFGSILQFDLLVSSLLMFAFMAIAMSVTAMSADRIFRISAGARTERITTMGEDNIIIRGLRRLGGGGSFGALLAINAKDYFRKAQNLSKLAYGVALATIMPVMLSVAGRSSSSLELIELSMLFGIIFAIVGAIPYVGIGFLESKDQLWIIQGVPHGASRFVKSRLIMAVITNAIIILIPITVVTLLRGFGISEILILYGYGLVISLGASMVAIGVTARNPDYEDTKSPAHQTNQMMAMMIPMFSVMSVVVLLIGLAVTNTEAALETILGVFGFDMLFVLIPITVILTLGSLFLLSGIRSLGAPEV
ncbi:MAG: hypothetical protein ACTSUO_01085 [Candidatus Thorarchaeota archaeon]